MCWTQSRSRAGLCACRRRQGRRPHWNWMPVVDRDAGPAGAPGSRCESFSRGVTPNPDVSTSNISSGHRPRQGQIVSVLVAAADLRVRRGTHRGGRPRRGPGDVGASAVLYVGPGTPGGPALTPGGAGSRANLSADSARTPAPRRCAAAFDRGSSATRIALSSDDQRRGVRHGRCAHADFQRRQF